MAHTLNSLKRIRQTAKRRLKNRIRKSIIKAKKKTFFEAIQKKDADAAKTIFITLQKNLDKATKAHIYHKNKVSRIKSELQRMLNGLTQPTETVQKKSSSK